MASSNAPYDGAAAAYLYTVIARNGTLDEVRAALEACSPRGGPIMTRGSSANHAAILVAAANRVEPTANGGRGEAPIEAADRLERGDLVGLLLEAGAEPVGFHRPWDNKIAICVDAGQANTLRVLLRSGVNGGDANARFPYDDPSQFCTAMHLCVSPPTPERLECLKVLVKEFGGDVNPDHDAALDLLVELGADLEARDNNGDTVIRYYAEKASFESLKRLLDYGASVDARGTECLTPLVFACWAQRRLDCKDVILELLRWSSQETRRVVDDEGDSAIDWLVDNVLSVLQPWQEHRVLPIAAALSQRQEDELAWFELGKQWDWRGHDEVVGLVFDLLHAQDEEQAVAKMRTRLEKVKAELRELGEEVEDEEPGEGAGSGGGGGGN